jgi:hypothetical protein
MAKPSVFYPILGYVKAELIINSIFVLIVLLVVSLRVTGRVMGPGLGWDDGLVLVATVRASHSSVALLTIFLTLSQPLAVAMLICQGFCKLFCVRVVLICVTNRLLVAPVGNGYELAKYPEREFIRRSTINS